MADLPRVPPDRLMLLDTASLYFRAFHGVPSSVRAPDGTPVNAVRGLLDVIARQITDLRPDRLVACFDADWRPAFRVALLPSYKAHRVADEPPPAIGAGGADAEGGPAAGFDTGSGSGGPPAGLAEQVPDDLETQLPIIDAALAAFGLATAAAPGYEADDVIGTLTARHDGPVDILTGDRDLFQLIDDARQRCVRYSVEKFARIDEAAVRTRYAIPGTTYADFAVLRGDPSDGLPGVAGIGAKTAAAIMSRFGSLAAARAAAVEGRLAGFPPGAARRLLASADYLDAASQVVRVVLDIDLPPIDATLPDGPADPDAVDALARRYGLAGSCGRLSAALRGR